MSKGKYTRIIGTGCYLPPIVVKNDFFLNHEFFEASKKRVDKSNEEIIQKFYEITNIAVFI